jgi:hypothetical protein
LRSKIGALGKPNTNRISAANPLFYRGIKTNFAKQNRGFGPVRLGVLAQYEGDQRS